MPSLDPAVQTGLHCHNQDPLTVGLDLVWKERGRLSLSSLSMLSACQRNSIRETADSFKQHFIIRLAKMEQSTMHFNSCAVKAQRTATGLRFYREVHPFSRRGR
jgi:hypothetical protein